MGREDGAEAEGRRSLGQGGLGAQRAVHRLKLLGGQGREREITLIQRSSLLGGENVAAEVAGALVDRVRFRQRQRQRKLHHHPRSVI